MYKRLFTSVSSGHAFSTDDHIKGRDDRLNEKNVCDRLLSELPKEDREFLQEEYDILVDNAEELPFIERVVADSRSIGLYHTSGLSTPSQVFMDFMALTHLVYENKDEYIKLTKDIVNERYLTLMNALGLEPDEGTQNTKYYVLINLLDLVRKQYGDEFAAWFEENYKEMEFLDDLARKKGVVVMYGPGFDADENTVRISLANGNTEDYEELARRLFELLGECCAAFEKETLETAA